METPPEFAALFTDLGERAQVLTELDGPQIEGWASGLFSILDEPGAMRAFVDHCTAQTSPAAALLCRAVAELARGLDDDLADRAAAGVPEGDRGPGEAQIGRSVLHGAWSVVARFGRSIVLGFDVPQPPAAPELAGQSDAPVERIDLRHSVLIEIDEDGMLEDIELAGPAEELLAETRDSPERVDVEAIDPASALELLVASWPHEPVDADSTGPGTAANQQFVRRRVLAAGSKLLPTIQVVAQAVDIRRGMAEHEFVAANEAARSTLGAAIPDTGDGPDPDGALVEVWAGVIRGDAGELSARERKALLWLEWADWLGVGIGLLRGGPGSIGSGSAFVDLVNRCPEVSSTIDKSDREYAEWAFEVAIDILSDGEVFDEGTLTEAGHAALHPAMLRAWGPPAE